MNDAAQATAYRRMVEAEWCDAETVHVWARWHNQASLQSEAIADRLAVHARLRPGIRLLDLACGTGDPAIRFARCVAPDGHVTATDLSPGMVEVARLNASSAGMAIDVRQADMQDLPFDDASFDAVTCKFGIMYAVDVDKALAEVARVLKPNGRAAFAVWGQPCEGSYSAFVLGPFLSRRPPQTPPPEMPYPLRFAEPGRLGEALRTAEFAAVEEEATVLPFNFPGSPAQVWEHFYDAAAPMRGFIDGFSAEVRAQAFAEALAMLSAQDQNTTALTVAINFASASRARPTAQLGA